MFPFYTPLKHQKFFFFFSSGVFRGYKMETLARNGLKNQSLFVDSFMLACILLKE